MSLDDLRDMLAARFHSNHVLTLAFDFKRYVGAQIGIYNPRGEKVGSVGKLRNTEHLLVATTDRPSASLRALARIHAQPATVNPVARLQPVPSRALAS